MRRPKRAVYPKSCQLKTYLYKLQYDLPSQSCIPYSLQRFEFGRPDLVAGEIPFMQCEKFVLGDFFELVALASINVFLRPRIDVPEGLLFSGHAPAHGFADNIAHGRTVPEPEGIELAE